MAAAMDPTAGLAGLAGAGAGGVVAGTKEALVNLAGTLPAACFALPPVLTSPPVPCRCRVLRVCVCAAEKVDVSRISVLNADSNFSNLKGVLRGDAGASLRSDADVDHQLLIYVAFMEPVKVHGICFTTAGAVDGKSAGDDSKKVSGPKSVKVFATSANLDFDGAANTAATQTFVLTAAQLDGRELLTNFVKFQNVTHLTVRLLLCHPPA
jgi:hypothetical protein